MTNPERASATSRTLAGPVRAVHALTLGEVQVRPKNLAGTGTPMLWWTLTARTWSPWLPVHAFVIEHERGTLLFDTGQSPASQTDPDFYPRGPLGWVYRRQARFRVLEHHDLVTQLAAVGHPVSSLTHVAISHLHQDHAGNLDALGDLPVLLHPAELALLNERRPELHGVLTRHLPTAALRAAPFTPTTDPALGCFGEAHDVFGDGTVLLLPTPGHSPGSMSALIRRPDAAPLLLVGDATYDPSLLLHDIVPDVGDRPAQLATARRIQQLLSALPTLRILAAHDPAVSSLLTTS